MFSFFKTPSASLNVVFVVLDVVIALAVCGCVLLLLVLLLFIVLCRQSEPKIGYSHIVNQSDDPS